MPSATHVVALLGELRPLSSYSKYLFPGLRPLDRCLSDAAIGAAFRRLGFSKDEASPQGCIVEVARHSQLVGICRAQQSDDLGPDLAQFAG